MFSPLRAALLIGAALPLFALAQSPPTCGATAARLGSHSTPLGQQLVQVTVSPPGAVSFLEVHHAHFPS